MKFNPLHVELNCRNVYIYIYIISPQWSNTHDDVIKWKHFPRYWPSVRGIHRSPVNSPHKGQWRRALMFSLICAWINRWLSKQSRGWWLETPSRPLWRNCNAFKLIRRHDRLKMLICNDRNSACKLIRRQHIIKKLIAMTPIPQSFTPTHRLIWSFQIG